MMNKNLRLWTVLLVLFAFNIESYAARSQVCCGATCGSNQCSIDPNRPNGLKKATMLIPAFHPENRTKNLSTRSTAITIQQSDINGLMTVGKSELLFVSKNSVSFSMDIGSANNSSPQEWELPANVASMMVQVGKRDFINLASVTPVEAQVSGATHVYKETITDGGEQYINYHFFNLDSDDLEDLGQNHVRVSDNVLFEDDGESTEQYSDAPLELGDSFDSHEEVYDMDGTGIDTYNDATTTMDAFGTIDTPFGTFDCLRGSITQNTTAHDASSGALLSTPAASTSYSVFWITRDGFRFYAEVVPTATGSQTITNFSMQYVTNTSSTVLPVELIEFKGWGTTDGNLLTWVTANEKDNAGFEIQRSTDGKNFEKIDFVKGHGTTQSQQVYTYNDRLNAGKTTYYRLVQVNFDGGKSISNIVSIEAREVNKSLKVYPNPTNGNEVTLELPENTEGVEVINSLGQTVFSKKTNNIQTVQLDINQWAQGVYFVKSGKEIIKLVKSN